MLTQPPVEFRGGRSRAFAWLPLDAAATSLASQVPLKHSSPRLLLMTSARPPGRQGFAQCWMPATTSDDRP